MSKVRLASSHYLLGCITALSMVLMSISAFAAPITVPTGLNVGEVFLTSLASTASSTNIADYNAFVQSQADASALGALGATASTAAVDARDNTNTNPASPGVAIFNLGDALVANNNADLWDGTIGAPINVDENGNIGFASDPFTGTTSSGVASANPLGSVFPDLVDTGTASAVTAEWITATGGETPDFFTRSLYAISDVLTVQAAVPEPGTLAFLPGANRCGSLTTP